MAGNTDSSIANGWNHAQANCAIGDIAIDRVVDLERLAYAAKFMLPTADEAELRRLAADMGPRIIDSETMSVSLSFHAYVVRTPKHTILVDTCCGNDKGTAATGSTGIVATVPSSTICVPVAWNRKTSISSCAPICMPIMWAGTQSWSTENGWPTFPNAQYLFAEVEYRHWIQQQAESDEPILHGSHADSVLPVVESGQAKMVAVDHEIETGVYFQPAFGHTPGTIVLHVDGQDAQAVLCGDVMHHPSQVVHPEWSSAFCADPIQSAKSRRELLDRVAGTGTLVLPAHFLAPYYGPVERDGEGFRTVI